MGEKNSHSSVKLSKKSLTQKLHYLVKIALREKLDSQKMHYCALVLRRASRQRHRDNATTYDSFCDI